jgi:hypothetical protein
LLDPFALQFRKFLPAQSREKLIVKELFYDLGPAVSSGERHRGRWSGRPDSRPESGCGS